MTNHEKRVLRIEQTADLLEKLIAEVMLAFSVTKKTAIDYASCAVYQLERKTWLRKKK